MDIREIQIYKLRILSDFADFCKKNNLRYCLHGGTLLGAIRHGGFIPWDDDIDVIMPWKDYKRFLRIWRGQMSDRYFVQNYKTDPCFPMMYTQLRVNGTTSMPVKNAPLDMHWGICIDIFPLVGLNESKAGRAAQKKMIALIYSLLAVDIIKALGVPHAGMQKAINRIPRKSRHLIVDVLYRTGFSSSEKNKGSFDLFSPDIKDYGSYENWLDTMEVPFEDMMFPIPKKYDEILTIMYGDYMTPPPEDQRGGHEIQLGEQIIDFETDYSVYREKLLHS